MIACRLFGTKPLSEPILACCQLDPKEHVSMKLYLKYQKFSFIKMHLKMSVKCRPFCRSLSVLTVAWIIHPPQPIFTLWRICYVINVTSSFRSYIMAIDITASHLYFIAVGFLHYSDVMMSAMVSQITSLTIVYSTVYTSADLRKHESSASQAGDPHKWPITRKMSIWWRHHVKCSNLVS